MMRVASLGGALVAVAVAVAASAGAQEIVRHPYPASPTGQPLPISRVVEAGALVHVSGMLGTVAGGGLAEGVEAQTERAIDNIEAALAVTGHGLSDIATCTAYLTDMKSFAAFNKAFAKRFAGHPPARTTVGVAALPLGGAVEITCTAHRRPKA
jgi:2-iminobutanoate/2-iminopropanoate deaminase